MAKLTLSDPTNFANNLSSVATITANNRAVEAALEKTLSRDGTTPNTMSADLDMNSNQILNLPTPVSNSEPVTKGYGDANYGGSAAAAAAASASSAAASASLAQTYKESGFSLAISIPGGSLGSSEWLFGYTFDVAVNFPTSLSGSKAKAGVAATGSTTLSVKKNGTQFGTIVFAAGATSATFTGSSTNFAVGDLLEVYAPASADATLAHLAITLSATRT